MFQLSVQIHICENGCGGGLPVSEAGTDHFVYFLCMYILHFPIFMFQLSVQMCENGCGGGLPVSEAAAERPGSNFPQVALSLRVRAQFTYVYNSLFRISGWQVALCSLTESQHNANIEPCLQPLTQTHIHKKKSRKN